MRGTPVTCYLPTHTGDSIRAKGNSGDMVIKDNTRDNRRSEVSHNDEIWAQRLGKARNLFSSENKVVEILHEASRSKSGRNVELKFETYSAMISFR